MLTAHYLPFARLRSIASLGRAKLVAVEDHTRLIETNVYKVVTKYSSHIARHDQIRLQ